MRKKIFDVLDFAAREKKRKNKRNIREAFFLLILSFSKSLEFGLYPFIVGDLMKLLLAAMVLPSAWYLFDKSRLKT